MYSSVTLHIEDIDTAAPVIKENFVELWGV